jgi:hypothetical protein
MIVLLTGERFAAGHSRRSRAKSLRHGEDRLLLGDLVPFAVAGNLIFARRLHVPSFGLLTTVKVVSPATSR